MASKKKRSSRQPRKPLLTESTVQFLTRQSPEVYRWLNETSAEAGISRDLFIRSILTEVMHAMKQAAKPGTTESSLFEKHRQDMTAVAREVFAEHLNAVSPIGLAARAGRAKGRAR